MGEISVLLPVAFPDEDYCSSLHQSTGGEDTPRRLMITHTIESYWIPSQKKTKSNLQI